MPNLIGKRVRLKHGHIIWMWNYATNRHDSKDIRPELVGKEATVLYSYNSLYGDKSKIGNVDDSYGLLVDDYGQISWFKYPYDFKVINTFKEWLWQKWSWWRQLYYLVRNLIKQFLLLNEHEFIDTWYWIRIHIEYKSKRIK